MSIQQQSKYFFLSLFMLSNYKTYPLLIITVLRQRFYASLIECVVKTVLPVREYLIVSTIATLEEGSRPVEH